MSQILTESQLKTNVIKMMIKEGIAKNENEAIAILNEGLWDKIKTGFSNLASTVKHQASKLGTITAGGKYFGQTKSKLAAQSQMDAEMGKRGNKMIRDLDQKLKSQFPGFPNVKDKAQFISGIEAISQVYESIVAATKLEPGSKGYLTPRKANNIIKSLRMYVQKTIDYDLASVYRMFNEEDEKFFQENQHILFEAVAAKQQGPLTGSKETETEKVYKSNKAPLTLLSIGTALGAFSWLVNTDWFKNLFAVKQNVPVTEWMSQDSTKALGSIQPNQGLTQALNATVGAKLTAASSPEQFVDALSKIGNGNAMKGAELLAQKGGMFPDAAGAKAAMIDIVKNPHGHGDSLGEIFQGKLAGTGKEIGDLLVTKPGSVIVGAITSMVPKIVMMTAIKTGAGYAAAKGLGGVLGPIGIGLVAAGALTKALRVKGLKNSRMKTLKDLLVSMNDLAILTPQKKEKTKPEEPQKAQKATPKTKPAEAPQKQGQPTTTFNYSQPGATQPTTTYSVPGATPQFSNASATTTPIKTKRQPARGAGGKFVSTKAPGEAAPKKTTKRATKKTNLQESFRTIVSALNNKGLI